MKKFLEISLQILKGLLLFFIAFVAPIWGCIIFIDIMDYLMEEHFVLTTCISAVLLLTLYVANKFYNGDEYL